MDNRSFDSGRIARGYLQDRPWLHPQVLWMVRQELGLTGKLEAGLDIGCGAGLSAKALKELCGHVTGVDISPEMIRVCRDAYGEGYDFLVSKAEEVCLGRKFDIVTAAGVVNWVEEDAFWDNLKNLLKENGIVCIYDFWITDEMEGCPAFKIWWDQEYLPRFPKPFRKEHVWGKTGAAGAYTVVRQRACRLTHTFDLEAFVRFMMIQSNVNGKIESGKVQENEVRQWLEESLQGIFAGQPRKLVFLGYVWIWKLGRV